MRKKEINVYGQKYDVASLRKHYGQECLVVDGDSMLCKVDGKYFEVKNVESPYEDAQATPLTREEAEKWAESSICSADKFVKVFRHESECLREREREEEMFEAKLEASGMLDDYYI